MHVAQYAGLPVIRRIFPRSFTFCLKPGIRLHVKKMNGTKKWLDPSEIDTEYSAMRGTIEQSIVKM